MKEQSVVIVTVNYKTATLTCNAIDSVSLERSQLPNLRMIVVDNFSGDDSVDIIKEHIQKHSFDWVRIIPSAANRGYAAGNNIGFLAIEQEHIPCDYVWMLNPDTRLRAGAGVELVNFLEQHGDCIAGSRLEDEDGTPQISSFNYPGVLSELSKGMRLGLLDKYLKSKLVVRPISESVERCDWLAGASIMMKYSVMKDLGYMDESYFLYFEEVDYCLKAQRRGYPCWYVPSSKVFHAVGAATGISNHRLSAPRRPQYWFDSRRRFFLKNFGQLQLVLADCAFILGYTTWVMRAYIFRDGKLSNEPPKFLRDFIKNSFIFRGLYFRASDD